MTDEDKIRAFIAARSRPGEGDCIEWTGSFDSSGCPVMRKPGDRLFTAVRRIKLELAGKPAGEKFATMKCNNPLCICDDHIVVLTRLQLQRKTSKLGKMTRTPAQRKKMAEKRRETAKMTPEIVAEMRVSGLTTAKAGEAFGISQSCAARIMSYKSWKNYGGPFAGLL